MTNEKFTISKLKQCGESELVNLGVTKKVAREILSDSRPPIPADTLNKVLYEADYTCCVCKYHPRPIIVHHIREWKDSRSHDDKNLVVLCLICHGEAHTKRDLSINLTASRLLALKKLWLQERNKLRLDKRIAPSSPYTCTVWDYFNLKRLLPAATECGVRFESCKYYKYLVGQGVITKGGDLVVKSRFKHGRPLNYQYESVESFNFTDLFYRHVLREFLLKTSIIDLSENWNRSTVNRLSSGDIVIHAGGWKFKEKNKNKPRTGPGQIRTAYVAKRGIRIEFDFDAWEATSGSSWGNLAGSRSATCVCIVRSVEKSGDMVFLRVTCLAIGTGFPIPQTNCAYN